MFHNCTAHSSTADRKGNCLLLHQMFLLRSSLNQKLELFMLNITMRYNVTPDGLFVNIYIKHELLNTYSIKNER